MKVFYKRTLKSFAVPFVTWRAERTQLLHASNWHKAAEKGKMAAERFTGTGKHSSWQNGRWAARE